jgi:hypothetical protein
MLALVEVKDAIEAGDRKRAFDLLKTILNEDPNADAWVMAARLTHEENQKQKHLRRALLLDPNHPGAKQMLRQLGITNTPDTFLGRMGAEFKDMLYEQGQKSVLLRRFNPRTQLIILGTMIVAIIFAFTLALANLLAPKGPIIAAVPAEAIPVEIISPNDVVKWLRTTNLETFSLVQARDPNNKDKHSVTFGMYDTDNAWQMVTILVYDTVSAIIADQEALAVHEASANVMARSNVILIYPKEMSSVTADFLVDTFKTLPVTENVLSRAPYDLNKTES